VKIINGRFMSHLLAGSFFILQMLTARACQADEITLETGRHLEGEIVSFEDNEITFKAGENEFLINVKMVDEISSESKDSKKMEMVGNIRQKLGQGRKTVQAAGQTAGPVQRQTNPAGIEILRAGR